jgi:hypothetical protein
MNGGFRRLLAQQRAGKRKIQTFWKCVKRQLRRYTHCSFSARLHLRHKIGWYLVGAFCLLSAMVWLASLSALSCVRFLLALVAISYLVDSMLVNASIAFVTRVRWITFGRSCFRL